MEPLGRISEPEDMMRLVAAAFDRAGVAYFVTGGMASVTWGEPRYTNDVDVVARLRIENVEEFCDAIEDMGGDGIMIDRVAVKDAVSRSGYFNIYHPQSGLKADVMPPTMGIYEGTRFDRIRPEEQPDGQRILFASPEDAILSKLRFFEEGGSEKHIRDIAGILKIQGGKIDYAYLDEWTYLLDVEDAWKMIKAKLAEESS